jgi:hypothetical protein
MIDGRGHFQLKPWRFFIHGPHQDRMPFESDHLSAHSQLDKVQMHIYPITTSKKPVVKVIVMSSRCLHQPLRPSSRLPHVYVDDSQTRRFTFAPVTNPFLGLPFASAKIPAKELFCFVRSLVSVRGMFIDDDLNGVPGLEEAKSMISTSFFLGFRVVLAV